MCQGQGSPERTALWMQARVDVFAPNDFRRIPLIFVDVYNPMVSLSNYQRTLDAPARAILGVKQKLERIREQALE